MSASILSYTSTRPACTQPDLPARNDYIANAVAGEGQGAGRRELRYLQADGAQHLGRVDSRFSSPGSSIYRQTRQRIASQLYKPASASCNFLPCRRYCSFSCLFNLLECEHPFNYEQMLPYNICDINIPV